MAGKTFRLAIIVDAATKDAAKGLGKFGKVLGGLGKVALGTTAIVGAATVGMGAAAVKLAVDAAPLEGIQGAFEGIATSSGKSADAMLAALQKGSAGMVTQRDLMKKYNLAASLVGETFANELPNAMGYLGKVASATGEDMGYMLDSLVRGVGRLSPMILDNLGIQVDVAAANEAWAEKSGLAATSVVDNTKAIKKENEAIAKIQNQLKLAGMRQAEWTDKTKASTKAAHAMKVEDLNKKLAAHTEELAGLEANQGKVVSSTEDLTSSMTKGQQQAALMEQVMEKLAENTAAMPDVMGSASQQVGAFKTSLKDFKDMAGVALLPALKSLMGSVSKLGAKVFPILAAAIERIAPLIEAGADALGRFLDSVLSGEVSVGTFADMLMGLIPPGIIAGVLTVARVIKESFMAVVDVMAGVVWPLLQEIFANLTEALALLGLDWGDVLSALGKAALIVAKVIGAALLGLVGVIVGIITAIASVVEFTSGIFGTMIQNFQLVATSIGQILVGLKGMFSGNTAEIKAGWALFVTGIKGLTQGMISSVVSMYKLLFGTIIAAVKGFVDGFIGFFKNLYNRLVGGSIVPDLLSKMLTIFRDGLRAIVGVVKGFIGDVISALSGLASQVWAIGASIMESLKGGIMSKVSGIISAIKDAIRDILDAAKGAIGMGSPAMEFVKMGHAITEGLAVGIRQGAGLPAMASRSLAYSTINNFNLTVQTLGPPYNIMQSFESMRVIAT